MIGCQKTNFLCCLTRQKAQNGYGNSPLSFVKTRCKFVLFNKYKHKILYNLAAHCLARSLVKTLISQEIFVTSVGDLKLNYKCRQRFKYVS